MTIAKFSQTQRNYIAEGKNQDDLLTRRILKAIGANKALQKQKRLKKILTH